jgi:hypothetical protein
MAEKSIKTITFSGTKEGYLSWVFKMRAFLRELGCADSLTRTDLEGVGWIDTSYGEYWGLNNREDAISVKSPLGNGEEEGVSTKLTT